IPRCKVHDQVAVRFPGTASAEELIFECPVCKQQIRRGFAGAICDCPEGGRLRFTVHRAASVYTPRPVVLVNPPHRDSLDRLRRAGGAPAALNWVLSGMTGRWVDSGPNKASPEVTRRALAELGYPANVIEDMLRATGAVSGITENTDDRSQTRLPQAI